MRAARVLLLLVLFALGRARDLVVHVERTGARWCARRRRVEHVADPAIVLVPLVDEDAGRRLVVGDAFDAPRPRRTEARA